jgi:DNA-binding NarL/FixJ family response regulator
MIAAHPGPGTRIAAAVALTDRGQQVLRLVARGMSNKEIGVELSISPLTVKAHMSSILDKLDIRARVEVAAWAIRHRLLQEA